MLHKSILHDSPLREEHEINLNGKVFRVEITGSPEGPVFAIDDAGLEFEAHEREVIIAELGQMSLEFRSRRLWGRHKPIKAQSWKNPQSSYPNRSSKSGFGSQKR